MASADDSIVRLWLHGKQPETAAAYRADAKLLLSHAGKPLEELKLADLQAFAESQSGHSHATRARRLAAVKSLLAFAHAEELITANVGLRLRIEKPQVTSADRILTQAEVNRMMALETDQRLKAIMTLLYKLGLRASEVCKLRWRDMSGNPKRGGEATVLGKGGKTRKVQVKADWWRELAALNPEAAPDAPVVTNRFGDELDRWDIGRAITRAARRAQIDKPVSPHWLRHSHASHALDNGAPVHVLRESMGHASLDTTTRYAHAKPGEGSASYIKG